MSRSGQKGFTLIEVLILIAVAIAILLAAVWWSSGRVTLANTCQRNLITLQTHYTNWVAACYSGDTVTQGRLVTSMNTIITQWNAGQCAEFGTIPAQPATCPPTPP